MNQPAGEGRNLDLAARRGEPSYVWRAGQDRRMRLIVEAAEGRIEGHFLDNGCGLGAYLEKIAPGARFAAGLEFEFDRARQASQRGLVIVNAAGEGLPFPGDSFDLVLSHEVIEHVQDDRQAVREMVRVLKPAGRIVLFAPNRGYPFETHGIFWRGNYRFGNIPLVNYLPRRWRDRLAPHVRVYSPADLQRLFDGLPVHIARRMVIFGAYDNLIYRYGVIGRLLRAGLQGLEATPLRFFGLSHFWVVEKL